MAATVICNIDTGVLTSGHGTTVATAEGGITHGTDGLVTSTATLERGLNAIAYVRDEGKGRR